MSDAIAINDMRLNNSDAENLTAKEMKSSSTEHSNDRLTFGDFPVMPESNAEAPIDTTHLGNDFSFPAHYGGFGMNSFNDMGRDDPNMDSYYGTSMPYNYQSFSSVHNPAPLNSFSQSGREESKLFTRHSLGGMYNYGESAMEPYPSRNDLALPNLQFVMDNDMFATEASVVPSTNQGNTGLSSTKPSLANPSGSLLSSSSNLFGNGDSFAPGFGATNGFRTKEVSPGFAPMSRTLNSGNTSFVLNSFDTDEYSSHYGTHALTPQTRTSSFTPMSSSLYLEPSAMNDFVSDSGYSPHPAYSPVPMASPHFDDTDLSPRRVFSTQNSSRNILMPGESSRLQRSMSSIGPQGITSNNMEMGMGPSQLGFHTQQSFKRKDPSKTWQSGDIESYPGHIKEMSRDHNGCRALQQCLQDSPNKIVGVIYEEVGDELTDLMMDPFGNYLFQKLLDVSTPEQCREVLNKVKHKIVDASNNVHGTRSVQKLIQVCHEPDMVKTIMDVLRGNISKLSSNANGNHVIQRCLQCMPAEYKVDVYEEVVASCVDISTHRHGCCVVQRCLDSAPDKYHEMLLDAIIQNSVSLICDPFGNYVIQYLIEHGKSEEQERITRCVLGRVNEFSIQKYSSNVIEKILSLQNDEIRGEIVKEIVESKNLASLLHDKYANYVIQKALKLCNKQQQEMLVTAIRPFEDDLSRSNGGKHILNLLNDMSKGSSSSNWSK